MSQLVDSIMLRVECATIAELVELRDRLNELLNPGDEGGSAGVREPRPRGPSPSLEAEAAQHRAWDDE